MLAPVFVLAFLISRLALFILLLINLLRLGRPADMDTVQQLPATSPDLVEVPQVKDNGPIPMSFPAILRHPGLSDRFAHLRIQARVVPSPSGSVSVKRNRREDKEGKRWVRRKENGSSFQLPYLCVYPSERGRVW